MIRELIDLFVIKPLESIGVFAMFVGLFYIGNRTGDSLNKRIKSKMISKTLVFLIFGGLITLGLTIFNKTFPIWK
jgi:hypothetical protein